MSSNTLINILIAGKVLVGLAAIGLGIHTDSTDAVIFGVGHAFILAPLWAYYLKD